MVRKFDAERGEYRVAWPILGAFVLSLVTLAGSIVWGAAEVKTLLNVVTERQEKISELNDKQDLRLGGLEREMSGIKEGHRGLCNRVDRIERERR
jgi:hypothetical protein